MEEVEEKVLVGVEEGKMETGDLRDRGGDRDEGGVSGEGIEKEEEEEEE